MQQATEYAGGSAGSGGAAGFVPPPAGAADERPNPWFSIWTRPRATMRYILDADPRRLVIALSAIGGVASLLVQGVQSKIGTFMPVPILLAACLVVGPIAGIFGLFLLGFLVRVTGRWVGGQADQVGVRAALAWSNVPTVWSLLLLPPWIALLGDQSFQMDHSLLEGNPPTVLMVLGLSLIQFVIAIWQLVVALKCIGEAHRFSAWLALLSLVLAGLILAVPIGMIAILAVSGLR